MAPPFDPRQPYQHNPQIGVTTGGPTVGVTQGSSGGAPSGGSAKPPNPGPMPSWGGAPNQFAGGSPGFDEAAGPGLPSWAGGGGGQSPELSGWLDQYQQSGGAGVGRFSGPENGWANGGQPPAPPGYIYDPDVTGGFVQNNPFTGIGAMQGPTPYQPGVEVVPGAAWEAEQRRLYQEWMRGQQGGGTGPGAPAGGAPGLMPPNLPGGAPNPNQFPSGPLGAVPPPGPATPPAPGGQYGGAGQVPVMPGAPGAGLARGVTAGGNPLGAVPPGAAAPLYAGAQAGGNPLGGVPGASPTAIPGGGGGPSVNQTSAGGMVGGVYQPAGSGFGVAPNLGGSGSWNGGIGGQYGGSGGWQGSGNPGGINPADVANPDPANSGNWREFEDNAYAGFTRQLDPQFAEMERQLQQDLSNRGIPPGSEAWNQAIDDFQRGRNDAYGSARQQSQQAGLAAQSQFFGQNALESQLANALLRSQWDLDARMAGVGAQNASTQAQLQQAMASLGLQRDLGFGNMGLQRELGLYGIGLDYDRLGAAQDQSNWGNLFQILNFGMGANAYNNGLLDSDFNRGQSMFGMIPGVNPGQIDVNGPYAQNQQNAQYQQQYAGQQQNGYYQGLGSVLSMLPYLFGGQSGGNIPQTYQPGPMAGGYNYPAGGGGWQSTPWGGGLNYGGWPGG